MPTNWPERSDCIRCYSFRVFPVLRPRFERYPSLFAWSDILLFVWPLFLVSLYSKWEVACRFVSMVMRLALVMYGLCIWTWNVNNVKSRYCFQAFTTLVNCYHRRCLSQDTSRILQTLYGDNNIALQCLWLLCGCSGCSCEKAIKVEKWSCALDLLTAMRGFFLHSSLFLFLSCLPRLLSFIAAALRATFSSEVKWL